MLPKPLFIHIPKNAGTSIREALGIRHRDRKNKTTHVPWKDALMSGQYNLASQPYLFAVVRNPYDRAKSIHKHFARNMRRANRENAVFQELCQQLPLNRFWERVSLKNLMPHIPHLRTQHSFLEGAPLNRLMRFESLQADWNEVAKDLGRASLSLPKKNASKGDTLELSDAAKRRIASIYAEDFSNYSYEI